MMNIAMNIRKLRYALARRIGRVYYISFKEQWDQPSALVTLRCTYAEPTWEGDRHVATLIRR